MKVSNVGKKKREKATDERLKLKAEKLENVD